MGPYYWETMQAPERHQVTELPRSHRWEGIPASSPLLCGVWGQHASAVAGDDAEREFWPPGASDDRIFDGTVGSESAGGAGPACDGVAYGGECRECGPWNKQ